MFPSRKGGTFFVSPATRPWKSSPALLAAPGHPACEPACRNVMSCGPRRNQARAYAAV
ncbi:hypothetical protein BIWAKO_02378 [Bosea sp. BIWAKO-01]|nr:hypothetical protein BIWAKO_02378 [Bosea sp. BIWAKO-01]